MRFANGMLFVLILAVVVVAGCVSSSLPDGDQGGEGDGCAPACPQISPPGPGFCPDGTIVGGGTDACGCENPPVCQRLQVANPASVFCTENGGSFKAFAGPDGEAGYCEFADGRTCEEWEFFRSNATVCDAPPG